MSQKFHEVHGNDTILYHDWTTAKRVKAKGKGLVFTSHPVKINEKITFKLEIAEKGNIAVGFTSKKPNIARKAELKPPDFWIFPLPHHDCASEKLLFFTIDSNGTVIYGANGAKKGHFVTGIDVTAPLWAVFELHTPETIVQLVNTRSNGEPIRIKLNPLTLCKKRGRNVYLTKHKAVKANRALNTCYVFTEKPVGVNEHVVVKILEADCTKKCTLTLGVTSCNPLLLEQKQLPDETASFLDRDDYWVLIDEPSWLFKENDEISFTISDSGEMKIGKNREQLLKIVHVDRTVPLWGVFDFRNLNGIEVWSGLMPRNTVPERKRGFNEESKNKKENENFSECIVCFESSAEAALYPCGHVCLCVFCAQKQWRTKGCGKCPMCRAVIKDVLRIYRI